jgi:hypothetical protein
LEQFIADLALFLDNVADHVPEESRGIFAWQFFLFDKFFFYFRRLFHRFAGANFSRPRKLFPVVEHLSTLLCLLRFTPVETTARDFTVFLRQQFRNTGVHID